MLLYNKDKKSVEKFQKGGRAPSGTQGGNPGTTPNYNQYYDKKDKFNQKQFFKDHPMPEPTMWKEQGDGRAWNKLLSGEQRAANYFSNNPYIFNTATGQWEAGTTSGQGTSHDGVQTNYKGGTERVPMRYVQNPYLGKEVGVPASRWQMNLGYAAQNKKGGILYK